MASIRNLGFLVVLSIVVSVSAAQAKSWPAGYADEAGFRPPARTLSECCPRPAWWDQVDGPQIDTREDFQNIWLSKQLSDMQKAKAMFRAIEEHMGSDDEIASLAINYYQYVDRKYPHILALKELGVSRYFDLDRNLTGYSGEVGDTTAGLVNELARQYVNAGRLEDATSLISRLVIERGHEINPHSLERASLTMADALKKLDRHADAVEVVNFAITAYDGSWEDALIKVRHELKSALGWRYYLALGWLPYLAAFLLAFLGLLMLSFVLQRRQEELSA